MNGVKVGETYAGNPDGNAELRLGEFQISDFKFEIERLRFELSKV